MCVLRAWLFHITCCKAATARSTLCDTFRANVYLRALPLGLCAQVCLVFVGVHQSNVYI